MNVRWRIALTMVFAAGITVAAGGPAHAIANGETVADGKYEFAVKITDIGIPTSDGGRRNSSCSGGLISPHWVITAGHCFRDAHDRRVSRTVAQKTTATIGRADLTGDAGTTATVVQVRQHGTFDVALARLDRAITDVTPLSVSRKAPAKGTKVRLAGFGATFGTEAPDKVTKQLKTGRFKVTSVSRSELGMTGSSPKSNTSPCPHDSGGAYFTEPAAGPPVVVGVVSHGPLCPHFGPDQAARVDAIAPWILSVIKSDLAPPPPPPPTARQTPGPSESASLHALPPAREDTKPSPLVLGGAGMAAAAVAGVGLVWLGTRRRTRPRGKHR